MRWERMGREVLRMKFKAKRWSEEKHDGRRKKIRRAWNHRV
jgi:hypothetical protein